MIVNKVRFVVSESCVYGNHRLFFGLLENSVQEKWYYVNDLNEITEMTDSASGVSQSLRVKGCDLRNKHFYKSKIEKDRIEEKKVMQVLAIKKM